MNKKGFTLTEILVVIAIIVIILLIAIPTILNTSDRSKDNQYENVLDTIKAAASEYVTRYKSDFSELINEGDMDCITLDELQEEGLIDQKLINPNTNEPFKGDLGIEVIVGSNKQLLYNIPENEICICNIS